MTTREKIERVLFVRRMSVSGLARAIGTSKQNLNYWLDKPDAPRNPAVWDQIAGTLGVQKSILLDPLKELPEEFLGQPGVPYRTTLPLGENLLDLLLDILQNPEETTERKEVARATIRQWLREAQR